MVPKTCGIAPAVLSAVSARWSDGAVRVGDTNDWLLKIRVLEANGAQHRPVRRTLNALSNRLASEIFLHDVTSSAEDRFFQKNTNPYGSSVGVISPLKQRAVNG
jgi:hypothetical protein